MRNILIPKDFRGWRPRQQIPSYNRRAGANGWPLCKHCKDM